MLPKISCYCATYGRPLVLEEAVYSFLQQDYKGEKELVILNDYDGHTLEFDHPEVKVFNIPNHLVPLGKKFNETVKLTTGDIIFPWEDDDIYLPHKISYTVNEMLLNDLSIFHTNSGFYEEQYQSIILTSNLFHVNMAMTRTLFNSTNGYYESFDNIVDNDSMNRWFSITNYTSKQLIPSDIFYIYRWATTNSYHGSWWSNSQMSNNTKDYINNTTNIIGHYILQPHWKYNYLDYLPL